LTPGRIEVAVFSVVASYAFYRLARESTDTPTALVATLLLAVSLPDLTASRVGLILANDLETAARIIATETGVQSTLTVKDRLRELLAYSVSEEYFSVRRHLGLEVVG